MGFTHLHVASGYSARYGASPPAHDLLQLLPLLVGQSAHTDWLGHRTSTGRIRTSPHIQPPQPATRRTYVVTALASDTDNGLARGLRYSNEVQQPQQPATPDNGPHGPLDSPWQ